MKRYLLPVALLMATLIIVATNAFAQTIPNTHPRIWLVGSELQRLRSDLTNQTAASVRFKDMVDRAVADPTNDNAGIYAYEPWFSAMMGVVTTSATARNGYCGHAVRTMEAVVASEEAIIAGGGSPDVAGDSYLEIGYFVGNVARVYDWCNDFVTPTQKTRWLNYSNQALKNIWGDPAQATWGGKVFPWSGWSVDNPVNNYYYSFLRATMLYGLAAKFDRTDADTWITKFRTDKIQNQLVPTFNRDLVGGGSREGTGYGTAMNGLFNLYYLWEKTTGERIADLTPHTNASMYYLLHDIVPSRDKFAPIGDHARDSTATFFDYQRQSLLALAAIYEGTPTSRRVRAELAQTNLPQMSQQFQYVYDYMYGEGTAGTTANLNTAYRSAGTGHTFVRSDWSKTATWLGFLNGPYTESHAHPDGLSILLYKNGWLINDANMEAHSGLSQIQESHALVTQKVNGVLLDMFSPSTSKANLRAMVQRPLFFYSSADQGTLFDNPDTGNPGVKSVREVVYIYPNTVVLFDRVQYTPGTSLKTFQLPTAVPPTISGKTATIDNGSSTLKVTAVQPAAATLSTTLMSTVDPVDFADIEGYRLDSSITSSGETRFLNVLSIDNAVTTVTTPTPPATDSVTLKLADGRTVLLVFNSSQPGVDITIKDGANVTLAQEQIISTIDTLPLFTSGVVQKTVSVVKAGAGSGTVTSSPVGINCGSTCSAPFDQASTITLNAVPGVGSVFSGWGTGSCIGQTAAQCQLNVAGDATQNAVFDLVPQTVPGTPTALVGTAGNASAQFTFVAPTNLGGSLIDFYEVRCVTGGVPTTAQNASSPILFMLANGKTYDCAVRAHNATGFSVASNVVTVTPTATPVAPQITSANSISFTRGKAEAFTVTATGTPTPTLTMTGALPNGISFDPATNKLMGTSTVGSGNFVVSITAQNGASPNATQNFTLKMLPTAQTIVFNGPADQNFSDVPLLVSAGSNSGLIVGLGSTTPSICVVSSGNVQMLGAGICTIAASQAGDSNYAAAAPVMRSFTINAVVPGTPTAVAPVAGNTQATFSFTAPVFTGGAPVSLFQIGCTPPPGSTLGALSASAASAPITVTGMTNGQTYSCLVRAKNVVGSSLPTNAVTVTPKASQTIAFSNVPNRLLISATPFTVSATGPLSGVVVASLTASVCNFIAGASTNAGTVTLTGVTGACTLQATHPGDATTLTGTTSVTINVTPNVPDAPQNLVCKAGLAKAECSFVPPAPNGAAPVTGYSLACVPTTGVNFTSYSVSGDSSPMVLKGLPTGSLMSCTVVALSNSGSSAQSNRVLVIPFASLSGRGGIDVNGDGKGEVFVRNQTSGQSFIGNFNINTQKIIFSVMPDAGPDWHILGVGDLGVRGRSDLVMQNIKTGAVKMWIGFDGPPDSERNLRSVKPGWSVEAIADLDGDGKSDIVWRFTSTPANPSPNPNDNGVVFVWFMDDGVITEIKHRGGAPIDWKLVGAADLHGNGRADLVWVSPFNTIRCMTALSNREFVNELIGNVPAGYSLERLGDFNGDGKADLLFRTAQGKLQLWTMNGTDPANRVFLPNVDATWELFAAADLNGDGTVDLIFRKPDNTLVVWLMNANALANPTVIDNAGTLPTTGLTNIDP